MSNISISKGIGGCFEPDDNSMDFTECANQGVVDEEVYDKGRDEKTKSRIDSMNPSNQFPT